MLNLPPLQRQIVAVGTEPARRVALIADWMRFSKDRPVQALIATRTRASRDRLVHRAREMLRLPLAGSHGFRSSNGSTLTVAAFGEAHQAHDYAARAYSFLGIHNAHNWSDPFLADILEGTVFGQSRCRIVYTCLFAPVWLEKRFSNQPNAMVAI